MFKSPLGQVKTSAPIRASDRRKLKQRIISTFSANPEDGDTLVPDGILTAKFFNYAKTPGTLYLDSGNGNPLWFIIGKESEELIPSVYTLWKLRDSNLLPSVLTPSPVIPILVGGADLMIPGVITHSPNQLTKDQLVAIHQISNTENDDGTSTRFVSPPLAVGRMAVASDELKVKSNSGEKGKAVLVLHTWKDHLWEMGQKGDVPSGVPLGTENEAAEDQGEAVEVEDQQTRTTGESDDKEEQDETNANDIGMTLKITYTPQEVTDLLIKSLAYAISTQLSSLPNASFPISSSQLYATYILPYRPAYPSSVLIPTAASTDEHTDVDPGEIHIDPSDITIKTSSHKSLATFLKTAEKKLLLTLKPTKQKSGGDLIITGVNAKHPEVMSAKAFVTIAEIEAKRAKRQAKEERAEKERERSEREVEVRQVWKPHLVSVGLFEDMGVSASGLYSLDNIRALLSAYFTSKGLINKRDQAYINLSPPLLACVLSKGPGEPGKKAGKGVQATSTDQQVMEEQASLEFMKRDELMKKVVEHMQGWYEVKAEGKNVVTSKGEIKPIQVEVRSKPNTRRAITVITSFEPFLVIDGDEMADKFRKICAGSTSVSPYQIPGTSQQGLKVIVQGKQSKPIVEYLMKRGISKKWIEVSEVVGKMKK